MKISSDDLLLAANTIRGLSMDAVQKANSGHPGMPMGVADIASVLFLKYLNHNPDDPTWANRDRFVLSAGHGAMLLYSFLHLSGYDLSMDDLKSFRQLDSKTPGHPEYGHTSGVETSTGPLGQGISNAVGMALAERMLAERFNTPEFPILDHYTYVMCGDGDLMEGISHEACSLAGHLKLNKLIMLFDSNRITIEGSTDLACSDDVKKRFQSYGWRVLEADGHDFDAIDKAIRRARREKEMPTIIVFKTSIGKGSPNKMDKASAHGEPLGAEEIKLTKRALGFDENLDFFVPEKVQEMFANRKKSLKRQASKWQKQFVNYSAAMPEKAELWKTYMEQPIPENLADLLPTFPVDKPIATRVASGKTIQSLTQALPWLVGGSADLAPSNKSFIDGSASVGPLSFGGRNLHFGIREHAMCGMLNGMTLHGGLRVYGATFFVFSDYCRPSIRLACLMNIPVIYVFTHDSFYVGEDGPTHEPVEHLASLRCMPNMTVLRPADATETAAAWIVALKNNGPTALLLTRQNLAIIDRSIYPPASNVEKGAYTLWQNSEDVPEVLLLSSGSEVEVTLQAAKQLAEKHKVRVVSMPSWELFEKQSGEYKKQIIPCGVKIKIAVEAGSTMGWHKYVGSDGIVVGMQNFGASAPYKALAEKYGFTVENIVKTVTARLG